MLIVGLGYKPSPLRDDKIKVKIETSAGDVMVSDAKNKVQIMSRKQGHRMGFLENQQDNGGQTTKLVLEVK